MGTGVREEVRRAIAVEPEKKRHTTFLGKLFHGELGRKDDTRQQAQQQNPARARAFDDNSSHQAASKSQSQSRNRQTAETDHSPQRGKAATPSVTKESPTIIRLQVDNKIGYKRADAYTVKPNGEEVLEGTSKRLFFGLFRSKTDEPGSDGNPKQSEKQIFGIGKNKPDVDSHKYVAQADEVLRSYKTGISLRPLAETAIFGSKPETKASRSDQAQTAQASATQTTYKPQELINKFYREAREHFGYTKEQWKSMDSDKKFDMAQKYADAIGQRDIFDRTIAARNKLN